MKKQNLIKILFMCPMLSAPLALGNYIHNNTLKSKYNVVGTNDGYKFSGATAVDRYYNLTLSTATVKKMLTCGGTSWFGYLDLGGWKFSFSFHYTMTGAGATGLLSWDDEGDILNLVNRKNDHVFTGKAPNGGYYHNFDNKVFTADLKKAVNTGGVVELWFYVDYEIIHDKYGVDYWAH